MARPKIGLLTKVALAMCLAGALMTVVFVKIENNMFVSVLHDQQKVEYEAAAKHALDYVDWALKQVKSAAVQCSSLAQLSGGDKAEISLALAGFLEEYPDWVRRAYYVDALGTMYSSHQVDLEVLEKTLGYGVPRALSRLAPGNGAVGLSEVYRSSMITENTVAVMRRLPSERGAYAGAVVLEIDLDALGEGVVGTFGASPPPFLLVNGAGQRVYARPGDGLDTAALDRLSGAPLAWSGFTDEGGAPYRVYRLSGTRQSDWSLLIILEENRLYVSLRQLSRRTMLVSAALFVAVILFLSAIVSHFIRPIRRLAGRMNAADPQSKRAYGDLPLARGDEIGDLSRSYARMMTRIDELNLQQARVRALQHESDLKALQYQLRPHFLYNTLNALSALALRGDCEKIPPAISALIHMLAMNTDKVDAFLLLSEELRCSEEFVGIMRLRFGDNCDLSIRVPEALQRCVVPKLILQPVVENSVFHGCAGLKRRGLIAIEGEEREGDLFLTVMDNGQGMSEARVNALFTGAEGKPEGLNSTGLKNTHSRIRLYFGEPYGLSVSSVLDAGTRVEMRLPWIGDFKELEAKKK